MATAQIPVSDNPSITPVNTPTVKQPTQPADAVGGGQSIAGASAPVNPAAGIGAPGGAHNVWSELVFAFIGTAALSILANMNERLGRVLLSIMIGFLLMWLLLHSGQLAGWINKVVPQTKPNA